MYKRQLQADPASDSFHLVPPENLNPQNYIMAVSTVQSNLLSKAWLELNALYPDQNGWVHITLPTTGTIYIGAYSSTADPLPIRWFTQPFTNSDLFGPFFRTPNTVFIHRTQYYYSVFSSSRPGRLPTTYRAFYG